MVDTFIFIQFVMYTCSSLQTNIERTDNDAMEEIANYLPLDNQYIARGICVRWVLLHERQYFDFVNLAEDGRSIGSIQCHQ